MTVTDLSLAHIADAASVIEPQFRNTPQYRDPMLAERIGSRVLTKIETLNPLRSFKGRGAQYLMHGLDPAVTVVCSSSGNFGQAIAHAATRRGMRAEVFLPSDAEEGKRRRTVAHGGSVHTVHSGNPKDAAREFAAAAPGRLFVEDGADPAISEGGGTIGMELAEDADFDTVVLPVGDAALITGVATWLRAHSRHVRIIGVTTVAAPAVYESFHTGEPRTVIPRDSFAAGISIARPTPQAITRMRALVDELVAVTEPELRAAMRLAADTLGVLPEPSGAAGLAAIASGKVQGTSFATVLTGANTTVRE